MKYTYEDLLRKLSLHGYEVKGSKNLIYKYSQRNKKKEVAGQIYSNKCGLTFYAGNVYPFEPKSYSIKDIFGVNAEYLAPKITPKNKAKVVKFTFDNYIETTQKRSQFTTFLKHFSREKLGTELNTNLYDLRGVKHHYLNDSTLFPYFDYNGNFIGAKIIGYNTNTGGRIKGKQGWFHSHKGILNDLGINETIEKDEIGFFGEHLLSGNSKPVVIVEGEKTAVMLSLIYKNIIFLATGGLTFLRNKNWYHLRNRAVYLFPDNNAKEWFEIAKERNWFASKIIEERGTNNEDIVDYLLNSEKERGKTLDLLNEELFRIETNDLFYENELKLSFKTKEKPNFQKYYGLFKQDCGLTYYKQYSTGNHFRGKNFLLWKDKFIVLTANTNFNERRLENGTWRELDADEFIKKLKRAYLIVKYLNQHKNILPIFREAIIELSFKSNHSFNVDYVMNVLVPIWNEDERNERVIKLIVKGEELNPNLIKIRNWKFSSDKRVETKAEFQKLLNADKKLFKTNYHLSKLLPLLKEERFIEHREIDLHRKESSPFIWSLVNRYNLEVLGCKTLKRYNDKIEVSKLLKEWLNEGDSKKLCRNLHTTYITNIIYCVKNCTVSKLPSKTLIAETLGINRRTVIEYFNFKPKKDALKNFINEVESMVDNQQGFNIIKVKNRLIIDSVKPKEVKDVFMLPKDVFNDVKDDFNDVKEVFNESISKLLNEDVRGLRYTGTS